jgi:hypothetical protein
MVLTENCSTYVTVELFVQDAARGAVEDALHLRPDVRRQLGGHG